MSALLHSRLYERARQQQVYARVRTTPKPERLEEREVEVLGRPAKLSIERVNDGHIRAIVCVRDPFLGGYTDAWCLPREVHVEAHRIARDALANIAKPTAESTWRFGFIVDGCSEATLR